MEKEEKDKKNERILNLKKNRGLIIIWVLAIISAGIYFSLPSSEHVKHQTGQSTNQEKKEKEYVVYFFKSQTQAQTERVFLEEGLTKEEELKALIQANLDVFYQLGIEKQKIELGNIYKDGNILYLTFNFALSENSQRALIKTIFTLGLQEEVRIL